MKRVVVLAYGLSSEKEVSLMTGQGVFEALLKKGYDAYLVRLTEDIPLLVRQLTEIKPDVVFNALHGKFGEDGNIQGLLNLMKIPYTHSGVLASAIGMNKSVAKKIVSGLGVPVAPELLVRFNDIKQGKKLPFPYVIKPINEGSSVGVYIIQNETQENALLEAWPFAGATVMMESYIAGREMTVSVLKDKALATTEIVPRQGFYDYNNKYQAGCTDHILPAPIDEKDDYLMKEYALKIHQSLGCLGASRCDFRYDDRQNPAKIVFLEINTQPGMTSLSLLPESARFQGIDYADLVQQLVEDAQCEK